jgi:oxygen-independent coproporphyrinogen-3 oxidase
VDTIYLGGGTPTCLPSPLLSQILMACREAFALAPDAEITVEANPGTVTAENASAMSRAGVNRLSLGAQSFHDGELRLLGRIHSAADIHEAVSLARSASIASISLDLIYGLPQQTLTAWQTTLEEALALVPDHLSLYALSVEEGTPLARSIASRKLPQPDPDLAADMYIVAEQRLAEASYEHYELSNWARRRPIPDKRETRSLQENGSLALCRHNLKYWQCKPYLGFGAGAHSFYAGRRYRNVPNPQDYVTRLENSQSIIESQEQIDPDEAMAETMILGLRLIEGVRFRHFQQTHRHDMRKQYATELGELQALGLLALDPAGVRLTPRGHLLANQVFVRFWPPSDRNTDPVA